MIPKVFLRPHCDECDGVRLLFESKVKWDFKAQQYKVVTVTGSSFCEDCDKEVKITWKEGPLEPRVPTKGWPEEASWIAQDKDGMWCWYTMKPVTGHASWITDMSDRMVHGKTYGYMEGEDEPDDWTTTLRSTHDEEVEP